MKLVFFEAKKSWLKFSILFFTAVLIAINVYKLNETIKYDYLDNDEFAILNGNFNLYDETLRGQITEEKINFIKENLYKLAQEVEGFSFSTQYDETRYTNYVYGDFSLFEYQIKPAFEYLITYQNITNSITSKVYENINFYEEKNANYKKAESIKILNAYRDRSLNAYYLSYAAEFYFSYDFSSLLILFIIVVIFSQNICMENECGTKKLIAISVGARQNYLAKCISAIIFSLIISAVFFIIDLTAINHHLRLDGLFMPIYSIEEFALTPFNFSIITMMLLVLFIRFIVFSLLALCILIISSICKNSLIAIIASFIFIASLVVIQEHLSVFINPVEMLSPKKYLANFNCVNFLSQPIFTVTASLVVFILLIILTISLLLFINRRPNHAKI